jgi:hypothetical protein
MLAATLLASAALLSGPGFPETFPVPAGSQPEGIAAGKGTTLYVAGGPFGSAYVYDARTGADVGAHDFDGGFVNDVTVTRRAAYFTDSRKAFIYVYPRGKRARAPYALPITGDFAYTPEETDIDANGIAATPDGRTLILVQSGTGKLFTADPRTGATRLIDAPPVPNGDGILLRGRTLYVVQNRLNKIAVLRLDRRLRGARLVAELTDADFDIPTTVAALGRRLYAVNARFSTPPTPETPYAVVKVG